MMWHQRRHVYVNSTFLNLRLFQCATDTVLLSIAWMKQSQTARNNTHKAEGLICFLLIAWSTFLIYYFLMIKQSEFFYLTFFCLFLASCVYFALFWGILHCEVSLGFRLCPWTHDLSPSPVMIIFKNVGDFQCIWTGHGHS